MTELEYNPEAIFTELEFEHARQLLDYSFTMDEPFLQMYPEWWDEVVIPIWTVALS